MKPWLWCLEPIFLSRGLRCRWTRQGAAKSAARREAAAEGAQRARSGGDSEPAAATVQLPPHAAQEIGRSLRKAGFQDRGAGVFVKEEFGVAAEVHERWQVNVDGVDGDLVDWMIEHVKKNVSSFGEELLKCAHARTANGAWEARLRKGETVEFRGGGDSLHPRIKSGECCRYAPVCKDEDIKEGDIVFCQIKQRYWGHMVKKKTFVGGDHTYEYTISNIHGWENGTCFLDHIYGKVVAHWM